jgi:hypothetical protein
MPSIGSMNTCILPPHTRPSSPAWSGVRSYEAIWGLRASIDWRARQVISASTQPPPMVPTMRPSG